MSRPQSRSMSDSMIVVRSRWPSLRRRRATAIVKSTTKQTVWRCLCGDEHSAAAQYRDARHVIRWRAEHDRCADIIRSIIEDGGASAELLFDPPRFTVWALVPTGPRSGNELLSIPAYARRYARKDSA